MKAYKKIISFILTLVMMLSLSVNVFAAEPLTDDPNMIEWKYTVFANESLQKVVEEGVIPNAYPRPSGSSAGKAPGRFHRPYCSRSG